MVAVFFLAGRDRIDGEATLKQPQNTLYFPCSGKWVLKIACLCGVLFAVTIVALGALIVESGFPDADWEELALGAGMTVGALWLGLTPLLLFRRVRTSRAGLWIDDHGFVDQTSFYAVGRVAWSEVGDMWHLPMQRQHFLGLDLKDPQGFRRRLSLYQKIVIGLNKFFFDADYFVSVTPLQATPQEILSVMMEYHSNHNICAGDGKKL